MNKLNPEYIHLLLDEPIYVLDSDLREHFESHEHKTEIDPEKEAVPEIKDENKMGILIINEDKSTDLITIEDENFLFTGLNALEISRDDVTLINSANANNTDSIIHSKQIFFKTNPSTENLYKTIKTDNIMYLECNSISHIRNNQDLKVKFWLGLKAMFKK